MEFLILFILILFNGFFALSEIALVSSKKSRLEQMQKENPRSKGIKFALHLHDDSESFLSAIQVGITLISMITGLYGGLNMAKIIMPFFEQFEPIRQFANEISLSLSVILITYVSIVIGELVPKTIALSNPEKISKNIALVIHYFSKALYPFVKLLASSTNIVNGILGIKKMSEHITEAELRQMIKTASFEGVIEKEQNAFHENIFYFADKKAQHLMTYRTDIDWIDLTDGKEEIEQKIFSTKHTKIVCCLGNIDNFVGILNTNDYYRQYCINPNVNIEALIEPPVTIPEKASAQYVLEEIRLHEGRTCFVVNEFGGLEGIITLYDIMKHIVGQLPDEGEDYEPDIFFREDGSYLINGDAPVEVLDDIIEDFLIDFEKIDYSTVAGFILDIIKEIPTVGYKLEHNNYTWEIVDMDGNRIDKILLTKIPETNKK